MLERIDTWIGKTLFVPVIIRLCQVLGCTQAQFHRVFWFAAALVGFAFAKGVFAQVFWGGFALLSCIMAASMSAHYPEHSYRWFRLIVILLAALDLLGWFVGNPWWRLSYDVLVLFAEYAATIRTIPPLDAGEKRRTYKPARAKG